MSLLAATLGPIGPSDKATLPVQSVLRTGLYESLPRCQEKQDSRLVVLLPEQVTFPRYGLHCYLSEATLSDDSLDYEALSYVWGDPRKTYATIFVNQQEVNITWNLYLALKALQLPERERRLWVDAICIDQDNHKERGHQVSLMPHIYSRASTVISWLGEEDLRNGRCWDDFIPGSSDDLIRRSARRAIAFLKMLCIGVVEDDTKSPHYREQLYSEKRERTKPFSEQKLNWFAKREYDHEWRAVASLWSSVYWSRVWVVQEVLRARKLIIQCECGIIEWEAIAKLLTCLKYTYFSIGYEPPPPSRSRPKGNYRNSYEGPQQSRSELASYFRDEYQSPEYITILRDTPAARLGYLRMEYLALTNESRQVGGFSLIDILVRCRWAKCSDPRDKVYGLLGITNDVGRALVYPDYDRGLFDIYKLLLCTSQIGREDEVVRLSQMLQRLFGGLSDKLPEDYQSSNSHSRKHPECPILSTQGTVSGSISILGDSHNGYKAGLALIKQWQTLYYHRILSQKPVDTVSTQTREALFRVQSDAPRAIAIDSPLSYAYIDSSARETSFQTETTARYIGYKSELGTREEEGSESEGIDLVSSSPTSSISESRPKTTTIIPARPKWMIGTRGQIGLVPGTAKEDDRICHFRGSDVAVIVRAPVEGTQYTIVGGALIFRRWDEDRTEVYEGSSETFHYSVGPQKRSFWKDTKEEKMQFMLDLTTLRLLTSLPADLEALSGAG